MTKVTMITSYATKLKDREAEECREIFFFSLSMMDFN